MIRLDNGRHDRWIVALPSPLVELIIDFIETATRVLRQLNEELAAMLGGRYAYN